MIYVRAEEYLFLLGVLIRGLIGGKFPNNLRLNWKVGSGSVLVRKIKQGRGDKSLWQSLIKVLSAPSKVHLKLHFAFRWKVSQGRGHFIDEFINVLVGDVHLSFAKSPSYLQITDRGVKQETGPI